VLLAVALVFSILIVVVTSRDPRDTAIEPGADVGGSPAEFLANALVTAAEAGDEAKVASLLASGANPNSTTSQTIDGFSRHVSALSVAVARGRTRIVRRLLHAGANPNGSGASGASLLADAIAANQTTIATLLRSAGARLPANASSLPTADGARPGDGLQTDSTLGRAVAIPGYIAKEHAEVLRHWLVQNPRFRIADYSDCACDSDLPAIRRAYSNQDLYYVADDLNGDGELDFAVVLIDLAKQSANAALAIFNGPLTKGVGPALLADTMRAPSGAVLFYQAEEHKLMLGKWESAGIDTVVPNGSRYSLR
jgi:ankyrin repeat protein